MANVAVIGAGYVGLVTSSGLAKLGHKVTCVEIDPVKLASLQRNRIPIFEPGLEELVREQVSVGNLSFTDDYASAIPAVEFCFVAVNTPSLPDGAADTGFVFSCIGSVLKHCRADLTLVIKSTVPVGTGDEVAELVRRSGARWVSVVSNPEFLRQGSALKDFFAPDRIVVGSSNPEAGASVAALYALLPVPVVICSHRSAELAKYAANAYLATRISFINEIAAICDVTGADVNEVGRVVGLDPRVGQHYLNPGIGWGGSCLPKDVMALSAMAVHAGYAPKLLDAVFETNARLPEMVLRELHQVAGLREGSTVGVLGLAFKPGTDDIRGAPAVGIIRSLLDIGCHVKAHDPQAMSQVRSLLPGTWFGHDAYEVAAGCDAVLLATEWNEYLGLDWRKMYDLMSGRLIFDGRNALDGATLTELGFIYLCMGRRASFATEGLLVEARLEKAA